MNRILALAETELVRVQRFDHPSDRPHHDPDEERAEHFSVSFVVEGSYRLSSTSASGAWTPLACS